MQTIDERVIENIEKEILASPALALPQPESNKILLAQLSKEDVLSNNSRSKSNKTFENVSLPKQTNNDIEKNENISDGYSLSEPTSAQEENEKAK